MAAAEAAEMAGLSGARRWRQVRRKNLKARYKVSNGHRARLRAGVGRLLLV